MASQLEQFKQEVTELAAQAFPHDVRGPQLADSLVARLCEETGEVAGEVRRYWRKRWGHPDEAQASSADVAAEIGDLLFLVARLADLCGVDLDEAQTMVLTKFKRRLAESGPRG